MSRAKKPERRTPEVTNVTQLTFAQQTREMLESFAVALILMLLMRNCLGENYQIPTGSMAPTLQGRHMDVVCEECGYQYRAGASIENPEHRHLGLNVEHTTCPICRFPMELQRPGNPNHKSFSGDRIIVSKLAYWLAEPERWDVIVFKCPADAKVNYIKRLIGLPGETLQIRHGDIRILDPATASEPLERQRFRIARKPPDKVVGMLQVVDDTRYVAKSLSRVEWPSRWNPVSDQADNRWQTDDKGTVFAVAAGESDTWLRYCHLVPFPGDWDAILKKKGKPDLSYQGMLITDYYEYNDYLPNSNYGAREGTNWVGDLALETEVEVESEQGELLLDLVEGGAHFTCRIDVATGTASLAIGASDIRFRDETGVVTSAPRAETSLRGKGRYRLRFANVDDQLFLWVNDKLARFVGATTYDSREDVTPHWSPQDPGDYRPIGIGARGSTIRISHLKVLRDVYYLALSVRMTDYPHGGDYMTSLDAREIDHILSDPTSWEKTDLFRNRRAVDYKLGPDQFFPLGDNSPQSKDARLWSWDENGELDPPAAVDRSLMIGKAIFIYWPHAWYLPFFRFLTVVPNYQRIGFIR